MRCESMSLSAAGALRVAYRFYPAEFRAGRTAFRAVSGRAGHAPTLRSNIIKYRRPLKLGRRFVPLFTFFRFLAL
jgi:hypothetical protein